MKSFSNLIILVSVICSVSCIKEKLCTDEKLSFQRIEHNNVNFLTQGFYYGNPDTAYDGTIRYETLCFYKNGVLLQVGSVEFNKLEDYIISVSGTDLPHRSKDEWGIYEINNNSIVIEHWQPSLCGLPTLRRSGSVINDTTFMFNKMDKKNSQGITEKEIHQTFFFRQLDVKPDSSNNYIK